MKFKTNCASVSWGDKTYKASKKGIITIPDDELGPFVDLIASGDLAPIDETAPADPTTPADEPPPADGGGQ